MALSRTGASAAPLQARGRPRAASVGQTIDLSRAATPSEIQLAALRSRAVTRIVAAAGEGDIGQALVDERFAGAIEVDMHQDPVGGLPLAAVARDGVAIVQVGMGAEVEVDGPA